jgi:glycosyltransferase involved in cell wall biosynthesis
MNVDEIASAIRFVLQNPAEAEAMGRRGRAAVLEQYSWSQEAKKLVRFYDALAA